MKLLHQALIPFIPNPQLKELYDYCGELRGKWNEKDGVNDYIFEYSYVCLVQYHIRVMAEMDFRNLYTRDDWKRLEHRGDERKELSHEELSNELKKIDIVTRKPTIYKEHDDKFLEKCIKELKADSTIKWKDCFKPNKDKHPLCVGVRDDYHCRRCFLYENLIIRW